ncbi:helix-turn-helix domain-containing protein [Streptomyces sp. f150]|uniref:helix-turn-helix domain-containing protein n=1 Tax=Streptomyces sp. f150 TaxID=1827699 RepID=UPI000BF0B7BB|nr:helix-turn-helix domain-containing protein [Streptomyces sp. f150]
MTVNHRVEAEKHLDNAARHLTEHPGDMRIAEVAAAIGQGHAVLAAAQDPVREQLATLLERWEEVADSYKPMEGSKHADLEERYRNYRYVQLRAIRNLRQVLDTGTMPCELATEDEQRRGDCGKVHAPEPDVAVRVPAYDPWATSAPREGTADRREQALKADQSAWLMLGRAIRRERETQQLSRRALSERAEVSEKAIQTAEEGRVPASRWPQSLNRITTALGMGSGAAEDIVLSSFPEDPPF